MRIKWYQKMSIWQVVIFLISPFAMIGEGAIFMANADPLWHVVVLGLGGLLAALKYFGKDENNNGIVDALESKSKKL